MSKTIIQHKDGKPIHASRFEVHQHIILKNFWEYYLEEADENGIAFGYVMGDFNEWGSVDLNEIKPYIISIARGDELNYVMPPAGYSWEDTQDADPSMLSAASETHSPLASEGEHSFAE
jgi:hypothetical protein